MVRVEGQEQKKILRIFGEKGMEGDIWALGHRMRCLQMACVIACLAHMTCSSISAAQALSLRGPRRVLKILRAEVAAAFSPLP